MVSVPQSILPPRLLMKQQEGGTQQLPDPTIRSCTKSLSWSTLSVPNCHATREKKHEGWDTARLPKPRQGKLRVRVRIRTTDLPINKFALYPLSHLVHRTSVDHGTSSVFIIYSFLSVMALDGEGSTKVEILPGHRSLDRDSRQAVFGFRPRTFRSVNSRSSYLSHHTTSQLSMTVWAQKAELSSYQILQSDRAPNRSAGAPFQCLTAVPPKGSTGAELLPGCAILDRESQEAETGFEPRTIRSANSHPLCISCTEYRSFTAPPLFLLSIPFSV
ncbi:hypothetical protein T265_03738 [Opisthorchis viverrini]|uniref:Uncharacterized protein n=1 Tax=Opisthorchis viverrini TaxID=6198 RepID=A0A074ZQQ0_OPIVI|nr:hypothetical protein T265_03738 [Opisthorchis viverrini]KER29723.1 hypothetical protein T265_03738 [Opisthorchis viverrini]